MKIIYYLKNLKVGQGIVDFINKKSEKLNKFLGKRKEAEEGILEVELKKDKETKETKGIYKVKLVLDLPRKGLLIITSTGRNIYEAINQGFKKLVSNLSRKK